ncbi:MAG: transcription elongation factor GreA [Actinobacteria bacterium]|nr:transcription elongation factor GreA [Actinomycetota bacterium]
MPDEIEPTWLTPAAHRRLEEELERLTTVGRRRMEERLAEARSHGDIRENADYEAAKQEQGLMEARIRRLRHLLKTAEVRAAESTDVVEIGSLVTVREDGEEQEYLVATPENRVPGHPLASPSGPLGRALLGARAGDRVEYQAPGGTFTVEIVTIRPFDA